MSTIDYYNRASELFAGIINEQPSDDLDREFPFYSLNAPGLPLPGPNFVQTATALGDHAIRLVGKGNDKKLAEYGKYLHYLYRRALYDDQFMLQINHKGRDLAAKFVPGHLLGSGTKFFSGGPRQAEVMIVGKHPGKEEVELGRNFCGPTSDCLHKAIFDLGISEEVYGGWYATNLIKFPQLDPNSNSVPTAWIKDCLPLLHEEIRLVRPKFMLCLGSDASKEILGKHASVTNMAGRVVALRIPLHTDITQPEEWHEVKVMTVLHPAAVHRTPELEDEFYDGLKMFWKLVQGGEVGGEETDVDHDNVYTERELARIVDEAITASWTDPNATIISIDAEWNGEYPGEENAYVRTIQFSYKEKWARCVVLRNPGGAPAFMPGIDRAIYHLNRLCKSTPHRRVRIGGHFLRADMPWLIHEGLDLRNEYAADPVDPCAGGFDTSLMIHSRNETTRLKLEDNAMRLLPTVPRYDVHLSEWRKNYCSKNKLKAEDLEGYGDCPSEILCPDRRRLGQMLPHYGCYDADVTRRIAMRYMCQGGLLDRDQYGNSCWEAYHRHHKASLAVLEMEMIGFMVDRTRADELTKIFMTAVDLLAEDLRQDLRWPTFNYQSHQQCVAALFGDDYARKVDKANPGQFARIRPLPTDGSPEPVTLGLTPVTSTGKRKKLWADLVARREDKYHSPSVDKEALGILSHGEGWGNKIAKKLRDLKFLTKVIQGTLRRPVADTKTLQFQYDEDGNFIYDKGLMGAVCLDERVRTHLLQTLETCRFASRRPNLQNLSKRREGDYRRILNKDYTHLWGENVYNHPIRSIMRVPPGWVAIEADIKGAELAVLAWQSQDPLMIDHVRRNDLDQSDPNYFGMHARRACSAFRLTCEPTKKAMEKAGVESLYVAAKNVNFGIPYGRSAEAIARQCAEEGAAVSTEQCQQMIDSYFADYVYVGQYLEACQNRSQTERWMSGAYLSYRRVPATSERSVIGEQKRQFQNFGIQNGVAEAMNEMLVNLYNYRLQFDRNELWYYLMLQIHDAVILLAPAEHAARVYYEVLPKCMSELVEFKPRYLDGRLIEGAGPYHFGIDRETFVNWGEHITEEDCEKNKLPRWLIKPPKPGTITQEHVDKYGLPAWVYENQHTLAA